MPSATRDEAGQATVEWVGLLVVVSLVLGALVAVAGTALPGIALARAVGSRIVCAVAGGCDPGESELVAAYGDELARLIVSHAPTIAYEDGMRALPIDYRSCREDPCSLGPEGGSVSVSDTGEPVTLFVHPVDCRAGAEPVEGANRPDCSKRDGNLYLQYWAYYPGSDTKAFGDAGYHRDDWESLQLRLSPIGADARASSHHGYNYGGGPGNWLSDAGIAGHDAWGPDHGLYFVSGGSHAGHVSDPDETPSRWTPGDAIRLIALDPISAVHPDPAFAISAPWRKQVWSDPEYAGTD